VLQGVPMVAPVVPLVRIPRGGPDPRATLWALHASETTAVRRSRVSMGDATDRLRGSIWLPRAASLAVLDGLDCLARAVIAVGVSANAVTLGSLLLAAIAGVLLGAGAFGWAAAAMIAASLGDALDGLVARRSHTASVGGAVLDASVDRYEEALLLGGLAVHFRASPLLLAIAIGALAGSFMVSYGSAKAEAIGARVPPGAMRRAERAACLCAGVALTPIFGALARAGVVPPWLSEAPAIVAVAAVAVGANVSAIRRLRRLARFTAQSR
jgi:CDP-diacylglycerol--glycerol-3-phosphate 3-phosphatidyltransferase